MAISDPVCRKRILHLFELPGFVLLEPVQQSDIIFVVTHCGLKMRSLMFAESFPGSQGDDERSKFEKSCLQFSTVMNSIKHNNHLVELTISANLLELEFSRLANSCTALKRLNIVTGYDFQVTNYMNKFLLECTQHTLNCMETIECGGYYSRTSVLFEWIHNKCSFLRNFTCKDSKAWDCISDIPLFHTITLVENNAQLENIEITTGREITWSSDHICKAITSYCKNITSLSLTGFQPFTLSIVLATLEECKSLNLTTIHGFHESVAIHIDRTLHSMYQKVSIQTGSRKCNQEIKQIIKLIPNVKIIYLDCMTPQLWAYIRTKANYPHGIICSESYFE